MLTYKKYGFGKVGYVETTYTITDDFRLNLHMKISKEVESEEATITGIELTKDEKELVQTLVSGLAKDTEVKKSFLEEPVEKYEDEELVWNGKRIKDEKRLKEFKELSHLIRANHEELATNKVATLYNQLEAKVYKKVA
jgi:hypothetical protein